MSRSTAFYDPAILLKTLDALGAALREGARRMGKLTTHVLDTSQGIPGSDIRVRLFRLDQERTELVDTRTNQDGRCDEPLLSDAAFTTGTYELEFHVAEYFAGQPIEVGNPAFLDTVTLRVTLGDDSHYHVPLLVSPWSYSTYRGS